MDKEYLKRICYLPKEFYRRGDVSIVELLNELDYATMRTLIDEKYLVSIIEQDPQIINDWSSWSSDKRVDKGWVFQGSEQLGWTVWYYSPESTKAPAPTHKNGAEACAHYILADLDSVAL